MIELILLIIGLSIFTAAEMALISADRLKIRYLALTGKKSAVFSLEILKNPQLFAPTILICQNILLIAIGVKFFELWHEKLSDIAITLISTFIVMIFAETLPKSLSYRCKEKLALYLSYLVYAMYFLVYPFAEFLKISSSLILRLLGVKRVETFRHSREEVRRAFKDVIKGTEITIIDRILSFWDKRAKDIMVPRHKIVAISIDSSVEEARTLLKKHGLSRLPVYKGTIDNIKGIIHVKDLFNAKNLKDAIRKCKFIPDTKRISSLLEELRRENIHMAIVKDEYGATVGLITVEDILEELFGEIRDEYDRFEEFPIKKISENRYIVKGDVSLFDIKQYIGIELPAGDYETISGMIFEHLERIPQEGETFEIGGYKFKILDMVGNRIDRVEIEI